MAQITVTASNFCSGGQHATLTVSGDVSRTMRVDVTSFLEPVSVEDSLAFLRVLVKLVKIGKTPGQLKSALQAGVTVNV